MMKSITLSSLEPLPATILHSPIELSPVKPNPDRTVSTLAKKSSTPRAVGKNFRT